MLRARVVLGMAALAITLASAPADARAKTQIFTQGPPDGFRSKPSTLDYVSQPFAVGVTYRATRLKWRAWGQARARATGRLRTCPNMTPCNSYQVDVVASGLVRHAEGTPDNVYAYVSFRRRGTNSARVLKLCVYAESCRPGPTPR